MLQRYSHPFNRIAIWLSWYLTRVYDQPGIQIIILLMIQLIIHVDPSLAVMCVCAPIL